RARDALIVESPEVLLRAATAPDDQDVGAAVARHGVDRGRDLGGGAVALHAHGAEDDSHFRAASLDDFDDVADRSSRDRGDEGDAARKARQRALPRGVKETLLEEPALQLLERELRGADPLGLDRVDRELV